MLYSILCYNNEQVVGAWTKEQDDEVITKLIAVQDKLARKGKLGPVVRLRPTSTARTLRKDRTPYFISDGPFAETKEQILGFYVVDCDSPEEVEEFVRELAAVNPGGSYEIRPIMSYFPSSSDSLGSDQEIGAGH